ncbi:Nucleotide-binding, alpha-beta plait [Penicillium roqueforti FM164]|uniref:Nucleotide-binding, alpha-beta plait n=1 Tax=Penicillium roqueforti (strain FM164) TaxID=1365484 RepID=W6QGV3_PENRF|nr:Nucleotide-binding, alpha-beta plait [Penicillium roqueforti FM164]
MDRSLDEIIAEDTRNPGRTSGGGGGSRRHNNSGRRHERDGVRKPYTSDRVDLNLDWVHDKFDDDRSRPSRGGRRGRDGHDSDRPSSLTKVRVDNLHYDITESDLEDLFGRIGPVSELTVSYDRAGRSEGVAFVTYARLKDAHLSIQEYDGANAKGQPIRLSLVPGRRERNPLESAQRPRSSLLDRVERPRDDRSMSPEDSDRRRRGGRAHRSDVTKPAPDNIDRYVPGQRSSQRSPNRRGGGRRGGGRDNRSQQTEGSNRRSNARPRKTQEELDQEMEDYWGSANNGGGEAAAPAQDAPQQTAPAPSAPAADDDIDMIE